MKVSLLYATVVTVSRLAAGSEESEEIGGEERRGERRGARRTDSGEGKMEGIVR